MNQNGNINALSYDLTKHAADAMNLTDLLYISWRFIITIITTINYEHDFCYENHRLPQLLLPSVV